MRLVHLEIRVGFAEEIQEHSLEQKVHKAITGKIPRELEQKTKQPVLIQSPKRKQAVKWDTESCDIVLEEVPDINNFLKMVILLLDNINAVAPIDKLSRRNLTTYWILPAPNYDSPSLEQKYREIMLAQNEISSLAADSSAIFDIRIGELTLHHQSGPMWPQQLLDDYLHFKAADIPKAFLFLWASIEEKKVVKYSSEEIQNYLLRSFNHCKSHSEAFDRIWEGIL